MPAGCTSFRASSTSMFTSTNRGGPIGKAGQPARPLGAVGGTTTVARDAPQRPSADPRWSILRRQAESGRDQLPCRFCPLGRADASQSGAHGRACGTRRHRIQGVHVELRHRRFPRGRRRSPCSTRDATGGGARVAGRRARRERRAHQRHLRPRPSQQAAYRFRDYLASRPAIAEIEAIARAVLFAEETGCALHVVHVSTGRGVAEIAAARARGVDVTAETCPHYLVFDEDDLERLGAVAKCAPPLRPRCEVDRLWQALSRGDIQIVASDHSPAPRGMKTGDDFFRIWGGISGCQSLLMSLLSAGHIEREIPLTSLASVTADNPASRFRMAAKGRIAPGYDADLVLVDLRQSFTLRADDLQYRHKHSPFTGMTFTSRPRRTILRGQTVAIDGADCRHTARPPGDACYAGTCTFTGTWVSGTRRARRDGVRGDVAGVLSTTSAG